MRRIVFLFLFATLSLTAFAQKEKVQTLKQVRGEYWMPATSTVTGMQAQEFARENAKRTAIEKVCGSRMSIWDQVESSSAGESFNSLAVNQVDGEILEFELIKEDLDFDAMGTRKGELCYYCLANIKVKRGAAPDPNFRAAVEGMRSVYLSNDELKFTVTPYRECYLKIFLFENMQTGYRIYPNELDKPRLFEANERVAFPMQVDFVVTKSSALQTETNRLVFVFTKEERPFYHETSSREEIERWMANIPNDEKYIYTYAIDIRER